MTMSKGRTVIPSKWVFKFDPYDKKAKNTIDRMRKALSPNYSIQVRGRGSRTQPGDERGVPLSRAQRVVVYIFVKTPTGRREDLPSVPLLPAPKPQPKAEPREKLPAGGSLDDLIGRLRNGEKAGV